MYIFIRLLSPTAICGIRPLENKCSLSFINGLCDPECDNEENLFDGYDCSTEIAECRPSYDRNCRRSYADGVCDVECDSASCAWDGGDCIDRPLTLADDVIVLTLAKWYETSGKVVDVKALGRSLSLLLRTIVRVMPSDWHGLCHMTKTTNGETARPANRKSSWHIPNERRYDSKRNIYIKIDNTMCGRRCFENIKYAAKFIDLALKHKWDPGMPISSIGGKYNNLL